jgi:hypothetical protein
MINTRASKTLYYLTLALLVLFSFLNFSEQFYPFLNSDMVINALMTPGFKVPGDLYLMGQDHSGSLIPLLASLLHITYHFPPVLAVSIVHYVILLAGFLAFSTLLKDRYLKLALAVAWFFPVFHQLDHLHTVFGLQMSMTGVTIYFINRVAGALSFRARLMWLAIACLSFAATVWISDLALISLFVFIPAFLMTKRNSPKMQDLRKIFSDNQSRISLITIFIMLIIGALFIFYAKSKAVSVEAYNHDFLSSPGEIGAAFGIFFKTLWEILTFSSDSVPGSIFFWAVLIGFPWIIILTRNRNGTVPVFSHRLWFIFFLLNVLITFVFVMLSHWVFLNGTGRRFFTVIYFSLWLAFLLYVQANGSKNRPLRMTLLFIILLTGAFSSFSNIYFPKKLPSRLQELTELKTLGNVGLIGDYRHAYLASAHDPSHIKATPHDLDHVRSPYLASEVFKQPAIYLIKDGWLSSFPDTIRQFGHILVRNGKMFHLAGLDLCRYSLLIYSRTFPWSEMKYQGIVDQDESGSNGKSVRAGGKDFDKSKHFVYGPFISLSPGKVLVTFRLKADENLGTGKVAFLDVSADYGKTVLGSLSIRPSDFGRVNGFQEFSIPVELTRRYDGIEFRVLYLGNCGLSFDKVIVEGI